MKFRITMSGKIVRKRKKKENIPRNRRPRKFEKLACSKGEEKKAENKSYRIISQREVKT